MIDLRNYIPLRVLWNSTGESAF